MTVTRMVGAVRRKEWSYAQKIIFHFNYCFISFEQLYTLYHNLWA